MGSNGPGDCRSAKRARVFSSLGTRGRLFAFCVPLHFSSFQKCFPRGRVECMRGEPRALGFSSLRVASSCLASSFLEEEK